MQDEKTKNIWIEVLFIFTVNDLETATYIRDTITKNKED